MGGREKVCCGRERRCKQKRKEEGICRHGKRAADSMASTTPDVTIHLSMKMRMSAVVKVKWQGKAMNDYNNVLVALATLSNSLFGRRTLCCQWTGTRKRNGLSASNLIKQQLEQCSEGSI
jgi:hypothetical protein